MIEVDALPFRYAFAPGRLALIVIDMQRDFIEPGGFGASLGNDVSRLQRVVPTVGRLLQGCRAAGVPIIHTRECHEPDLSDCPPAKRRRGAPVLRIGDPGPMGRLLIRGAGQRDRARSRAAGGRDRGRQARQGCVPRDRPRLHPGGTGCQPSGLAGVTIEVCVQTTMREANDRGFDCLLLEDATESYVAAFKQATLAMIRAQGAIVGWTATADRLLAALDA